MIVLFTPARGHNLIARSTDTCQTSGLPDVNRPGRGVSLDHRVPSVVRDGDRRIDSAAGSPENLHETSHRTRKRLAGWADDSYNARWTGADLASFGRAPTRGCVAL